jgi:hypothetical protein
MYVLIITLIATAPIMMKEWPTKFKNNQLSEKLKVFEDITICQTENPISRSCIHLIQFPWRMKRFGGKLKLSEICRGSSNATRTYGNL